MRAHDRESARTAGRQPRRRRDRARRAACQVHDDEWLARPEATQGTGSREPSAPQGSARDLAAPRTEGAGKQVERFRSEPALTEFKPRFAELVEAYKAKHTPDNLAVLWAEMVRPTGDSPVGRPIHYGALMVHWDMIAMSIRKDVVSITSRDWLNPYRIPPPPHSGVKPPGSPFRR